MTKIENEQGNQSLEPASDDSLFTEGMSMRRVYLGIFFVSTGVLLLQIALTRLFSYTLWHVFTYVTISLAMLGFGASGAVLASSKKLEALRLKLAAKTSFLAAVSVPFMLVVVSVVPFAPYRLFSNPINMAFMILYYLAVMSVFFCAGLTIVCAFRSIPSKATKIYFWDLVGAATGCLLVVPLIMRLGVPAVAALSACLFLIASALFLGPERRVRFVAMIGVAVVWMFLSPQIEKVLEFKANEGKIISFTKNKEMTFSKWSPIFRVDAYNIIGALAPWEGIMFGIKNKELPPDTRYAFIMHDGDAGSILIENDINLTYTELFDKSILKPPYLLKKDPKVLIIGPGGGVDVAMAIKNEARSIKVVELDPLTVDLVANQYADFVGRLYDRPHVDVTVDEGRSFLRRSKEKYDLIQASGVDTVSAQHSGTMIAAESYLYTIEALLDVLSHLNPDGIFSTVIFDAHYKEGIVPRRIARRTSLAVAALERLGVEHPERHIVVIASNRGESRIPYVMVLTKLSPFTASEIKTLYRFIEEVSFDAWHMPGVTKNNIIAQIATYSPEARDQLYKEHFLNLWPPTDDTPFFFCYVKWRTLLDGLPPGPRGPMGVENWVLLVGLLLSIVFSVVLIIWPLTRFRRDGLEVRARWNFIIYFAALGLGFIFLEVSYIQKFILFLGYPTYSLTVILCSLLAFSGVGSYLSGILPLGPKGIIKMAFVLLLIVALGYLAVLPPIFNYFLGYSQAWRIFLSAVLLAPLGIALGMFFPSGIRIVSAEGRKFVPWAWGINGCASVIGTLLSVIIAMTYGFGAVSIVAVATYCLGVLAMLAIPSRA